ncbi:MAG: GGDEF domain-containing protein [Lachnospiraceae bacterium]|nr:GGDEF domain-containing protein [Lachnospiraceae bacterium]
MDNKGKVINSIINIAVLISLILFLIGLFTVKETYKHNSLRDTVEIKNWTVICDGKETEASIPFKVTNGKVSTLTATLPRIQDGQELWFHCNYSTVAARIDGEEIYSVGSSKIFGKTTRLGNGMAFIPLRPNYSGRTIEVDIEPFNTVSSKPIIKHTIIMTKSDYTVRILKSNTLRFILAIVIFVFSFIILSICLYLKVFLKKSLDDYRLYFFSGIFFFTAGSWTVTDGRLIGAMSGHLTTSGFLNYVTFAFLSFCCAGLARALYVRKSKILDFIYFLAALVFVGEMLAFFIFGVDLIDSLVFSQIMGAVVLINLVVTSILMVIKGDAAMKKRLAPGVILMSIFSLISLVDFFVGSKWSLFFLISLAFLVITIVIEVFTSLYDMLKNAIQVQEMRHHAYTDGLTGLKNRRAYVEDLEGVKSRDDKNSLIIMAIDLNGLKKANDEFGHAAGDELIISAGRIIRESFINYGETYRMGGDEYSILFFGDKESLADCITNMQKQAESFVGEMVKGISISFGYAIWAEHEGISLTELEKIADADMYRYKSEYYKRTGKDRRR